MIREHFERHKTVYYIGGLVVIAGITCIIMRRNVVSYLDAGTNGPLQATTRSFSFNIFTNRSGNIVTTIHTGERGHPGFRVRHPKTDLTFDTQGAAARAFGIPENIISKHLNEKLPDAYGEVFERVGA